MSKYLRCINIKNIIFFFTFQTENCVASTSNGNTSTTSELDDGTSNNEISESNKIFKEVRNLH